MGWGLRWGGGGDRRGPTPVRWVPSTPQTSQDICCVVFAIFNVIWATLFLEEWKRRGAEFAYKWGTLDTPAESIEEPRPQFRVSTFWGVPTELSAGPPGPVCAEGAQGTGVGAENWHHGDVCGCSWGSELGPPQGSTGVTRCCPPPKKKIIRALRESAP